MVYDLVVKDGTIVSSIGISRADIGIQDGKIAQIAPALNGREERSAEHMLVLPGGVDPHVHIQMPTAMMTTCDTWAGATRAAALGGTTTVVDFVEPNYPGQPLMQAFEERRALAQGQSAIDYAFHMTLCSSAPETLRQVPEVLEAGMPSFKVYTTYTGFHLADEELLAVLRCVAAAGGLTIVHAESDAIIQDAVARLLAEGQQSVADFPLSRPEIAEKEAIQRVLTLADYANAPVYIVHVSTRSGAEAITNARKKGQPAWGETCPQYLLLDESRIMTGQFEGAKFVCCPPLRTPDDQAALWSALQAGDLQTVGTDHCAFNFIGQKQLGKESFLNIPSGLPGIELRMTLLYTYGVKNGYLSLTDWINRCCTTPARLFGLYPHKGDIQPGFDADLVIFDPDWRGMATQSALHENVDYTPYEGFELSGRVKSTLLRGRFLVSDGEWTGAPPAGKFICGNP
ncbi:D-hydantoinase [Longilinea arvoryzae]|uniref:D-hydantoinase n=2 Tax=Longilinea arvoryzae TaxID=360412 RepID=A0A0S7BAZ6_9CHLR|nr:D-hydantoinase [Longilinea arvoryzae]